MKITRTKPSDAQKERQILIGLIMSNDVCSAGKSLYQKNYFQTKMTQLVANWCLDFYKKYNSAPKQDIQIIFENNVKAGKVDPDLGEEIELFLDSISSEYTELQEFNTPFYVDLLKQYFKKRSYFIFGEKIREAADNDDPNEAEKIYSNFIKVQEQQDTSRNILDEAGIESFRQSVESRSPVLFTMPGAVGKMIGPIERETLIGILGREKAGKTYVLQMFAEAAAKQGLKVAFIQTGDLTQDQLDNRLACSRTKGVYKETKVGPYYAPVMDCLKNQQGVCAEHPSNPILVKVKNEYQFSVDLSKDSVKDSHKPCIKCYKDFEKRKKFKGSIWWRQSEAELWNWGELKRRTKYFKKWFGGEIVTTAFSMRSIKMSGILDWLLQKQKMGWIADVVLIDYPDITLPEKEGEYRHSENEKWMLARKISQDLHCSVIMVTQADAKSYVKDTLSLDNFSEAKAKYGHCTHFLAINKTDLEQALGCVRLGMLLIREDDLAITKQVTVIQDLKISKPYIASFNGRVPRIKGK